MNMEQDVGPRMDLLAIISLVAGILATLLGVVSIIASFFAMCCCLGVFGVLIGAGLGLLLGLIGLILGVVAMVRIKKTPDELKGGGLAIGGILASLLGGFLSLAAVVVWALMYFGVMAYNMGGYGY